MKFIAESNGWHIYKLSILTENNKYIIYYVAFKKDRFPRESYKLEDLFDYIKNI